MVDGRGGGGMDLMPSVVNKWKGRIEEFGRSFARSVARPSVRSSCVVCRKGIHPTERCGGEQRQQQHSGWEGLECHWDGFSFRAIEEKSDDFEEFFQLF